METQLLQVVLLCFDTKNSFNLHLKTQVSTSRKGFHSRHQKIILAKQFNDVESRIDLAEMQELPLSYCFFFTQTAPSFTSVCA